MQMRIVKIAGVTVFGGTMLVAGAFLVNMVGAQVATQSPDCNVGGTNFWGYVACWIGSPSQGIAGADTLFKGQKALSDKIAAIPGGGGGGSAGNPKVYIERKDTNGNPESVLLGQVFQGELRGARSTWGIDNCPTTIAPGDTKCPELPLTYADDVLSVIFIPDATWAAKPNHSRNLISGTVRPILCFVRERTVSHLGDNPNDFEPIDTLRIACSYRPTIATGGVSDVESYDYGAALVQNTPVPQQFRIVIK